MGGLFGGDARGQAVLAGLGQPAGHALDPLRGLALAENDLGEAAALGPVEVHLGVAEVGDGGLAEVLQRGVHAPLAAADLFEEVSQFVRTHAVAPAGRGEVRRLPSGEGMAKPRAANPNLL